VNPNTLQDSDAEKHRQEERSAVAHERKRQAGDRSHPYGHADIHKGVSEEQGGQAHREQAAKVVFGLESHVKSEADEGSEGDQEQTGAEKTMLLANDGKNEVVMHDGAGQEPEFIERV
jgi:hypothetical protein